MTNDMFLERDDSMYWSRYEKAELEWEEYLERKADELSYEHCNWKEIIGKIEPCKMYYIHADGCVYVALDNENGMVAYKYSDYISDYPYEEVFEEVVWCMREYGCLEDWIERIEDFSEECDFDKAFNEFYEPAWYFDKKENKHVNDFLNLYENAEIIAVRENAIF